MALVAVMIGVMTCPSPNGEGMGTVPFLGCELQMLKRRLGAIAPSLLVKGSLLGLILFLAQSVNLGRSHLLVWLDTAWRRRYIVSIPRE